MSMKLNKNSYFIKEVNLYH